MLGSAGPIVIDPEVMSGTPVFVGTRVPEQALLDHLAAGDSLDDFLEGYPSVSRELALQVIAAAGAGAPGGPDRPS